MEKTLEQLMNRCNELHEQRRNAVKAVLERWLESKFITPMHRSWKAIEGVRNFTAIPIYNSFSYSKMRCVEEIVSIYDFCWPDLPDDEIIDIIRSLGFNTYCFMDETVTLKNMCLAVPPCKKGEPLTFAQEWVKRINDNYSRYVNTEKIKAKQLYEDILEKLANYDPNYIRFDKDTVIFEDFGYLPSMSKERKSKLHKFFNNAGITLHYNKEKDFIEVHVTPKQPK